MKTIKLLFYLVIIGLGFNTSSLAQSAWVRLQLLTQAPIYVLSS